MLSISTKKLYIIAAVLIVISIIVVFAYYTVKTSTRIPGTGGPDQVEVHPKQLQELKTIDVVPTLTFSQGQGLDTNSAQVQESIKSIQTLARKLPYTKTITTSSGIEIEILIPSQRLLENEWTLTTHIFGIDYMIPKNDPAYDSMRMSFLEGAQDVYNFLQENGVDPQNVLIQWGDRAFIQERSQLWLEL